MKAPAIQALALGLFMLSGAALASPHYSLTDLASITPAGAYTYWSGMNNAGDIVGKIDGQLSVFRNGSLVKYDPPNWNWEGSALIGNDGTIAYNLPSDSWQNRMGQAFIFRNGVEREVAPLYPDVYSGGTYIMAINDSGTAVGQGSHFLYDCSSGSPGCESREPWKQAIVYQDGKTTNLGTLGGNQASATGINNHGVVVGYSQTGNTSATEVFIYSNGGMTSLGIPGTNAVINDAGQIAAGSWLYDHGQTTAIGLAGNYNLVKDINNAGQVLGYVPYEDEIWLYYDGKTIDLTAQLAADGWSDVKAIDLNDAGQILLSGYKDRKFSHFLLTPDEPPVLLPVPEPGTYAMLMGGLGVLAFWRRRRTA